MVSRIMDGSGSCEDVLEAADVGNFVFCRLHSKEGVSELIIGLKRWLWNAANKLAAADTPCDLVEDSAFGKPFRDE